MTRNQQIAVVCPATGIDRGLATRILEIAKERFGDSLTLYFHPQCFLSAGHFAGSDRQRSAAFLDVANDPAYTAVWFGRGGYGTCRLDDSIFPALGEHARTKTYMGYSDTGALLGRLYRTGTGHPVHGPMPADLDGAGGRTAVIRALDYLACRDPATLEHTVKTDGPALAFNLTVLASILGTPWAPDFRDHVLMLEDVHEYLYRIDRLFFSVTSCPDVGHVRGIRLGRIGNIPENDRPFGETAEEIVRRWCTKAGIACLGRADIGHDRDNRIVPFGRPGP